MRKRILELMPVLACLTLVLATAGPAYATFPGTNGRIAFTRQITTDIAGVFTAKPDGSDEQQVPLGGTDGVEIFYSGTRTLPRAKNPEELRILKSFVLAGLGRCVIMQSVVAPGMIQVRSN